MKSCNFCSLAFLLFVILIILILIRYYSFFLKKEEKFSNIKYYEPCSPKKFDDKLKTFYKISKKYRNFEKKMNSAREEYEKNYNLLVEESRRLDRSKNELTNCIRY